MSAESTTKAWQLRDRVSDRERFFIDFTYDRQVTGNLEKAYQTLELWFQTYPRGANPSALDLLGGLSTHGTGRFERAIEACARKRSPANPDFVFGYCGLASGNFFLDRFAEAENALQRASERKLEVPIFLILRYNIAFLKGDKEQMDRVVALAKGKQGAEHRMAHAEALVLARSGRLQDGSGVHPAGPWIWPCRRERGSGGELPGRAAVWEAIYGNAAEARRNAMAALAAFEGPGCRIRRRLALALSGDSSRSQALADDLEKRFPEDTFAKFTYVPVLRALSALNRRPRGR